MQKAVSGAIYTINIGDTVGMMTATTVIGFAATNVTMTAAVTMMMMEQIIIAATTAMEEGIDPKHWCAFDSLR